MKKFLSIFFAFAMLLSVVMFAVSCAGQNETEANVTTRATEVQTTAKTETTVTTKVETTVTERVETTITEKIETTVTDKVETTVTEPVVTATQQIETIVTEPVVTTTEEPVVTTTQEPVVTTTQEPVVTTTQEPVVSTTQEPVVTTTQEPVVTTTQEPVVTTTQEPIVTTTEEPVVTTTQEPVVTTTQEPVVTTTETTPVETTEVSGKMPGYEHVDFGGKVFRFAAYYDGDTANFCDKQDFWAEAYNGNALNDAVYERNELLKKLYNCTIEATDGWAEFDADRASGAGQYMGGSKCYDIGSGFVNSNFYNVLKFDIDYSQPWWDQAFFRDLTCNGKIFAVCGDAQVRTFRTPWTIFYNKELYESKFSNIDIYQLVKDKQWTFDMLNRLVSEIKQDINGDQEYTASDADGADIVGMATTPHIYRALYYAAGLRTVTSNSGKFEVAIANDKGSDIMDKINAVVHQEDGFTVPGYSVAHSCFENNKTLFCADLLGTADDFMEYTDLRMGILPFPLYDETQEAYKTYCDNHASFLALSTSYANMQEISDFLSVYYYHSSQIVRPAYINTIKYTVASDEESGEMVDLILNSRVYDAGYLMNLSNSFDASIQTMGEQGGGKWASYVKRNTNTISQAIAAFEQKINAVDDTY